MGRAGASPVPVAAPAPTTADLAALATGLLKNTTATGALSIALAGIDFSKGPTKLFSTVRLLAAAQTLSIPVVGGEANGRVRATGRLFVAAGSTVTLTVKINGSATNVAMQSLEGTVSTAGAGAGRVAILQNNPGIAQFDLLMHTAKTANALKRLGRIIVASNNGVTGNVTIGIAEFLFNDAATTITTIDLDSGVASGLAANSEALVEEDIVS